MRNSPPQHYGFQWVSYWLACSLLLLLTPAMGQVDLLLKLNKSSFAEQRSLLFKVDAYLEKDSKQIVESAELEFDLQGKAQLLSPLLLKIEMGADSLQQRRFKFLLQDKANQPDSILLVSRLKSFGTSIILAQDSLWITVNPAIPLMFTNLQDEIVIQGDSAHLPIRISNPNQDTMQTDVSIYTAADFIKNKGEQLQFRLSPQRDTIIRFPLKVSRSRPIPKNSPVFLKIDSPNETHTRLAHYQLYQLKSRNRFLPEGKKANFTDRFYADWLQGGFNNNLRLGFTSLGTIDNNRYELSFNPILFFDQEQLSLFNSYAAVHTPHYHWRVGNVQYNDELLLAGKTAAFAKKWNDSETGIAIVNSDQDLFSVFRQNRFANSNTLRLHFKRDLNLGWNWQTVLLQQWGDKANLGILQTDLKRRDRFRQMHLGIAFGLGNSTTGIMGGGFAIRADYEQKLNEWEIRAENYFASKNYPGLFGGQMQLREQVTYLGWQKWRISGLLNLNQFPVRNFFRPAFARTRLSHWNQLESQVTYLLPRRLQFSVTPVLLHQRVAQQSGINPSKIYNNYSPRTRFGMRKDLRYFSINANLDAGLSQTNTADERGPFCRSWRSNLSVNYRKTGLSMFYNEGPYYLFEEVEFAQLFGAEQFFSGNLYQKFSLFHGWIEGQLNGQVIYDRSRSRWNQNIRLGLSGMLFTGWQWRTEVSHLQSGTFSNTFFNIGVSKSWQTYRDFAANNRLTLQLFFDKNQNGERDETEEAVSGLFVKIDEEFLLTDNRGIARLSGLESQGYQLSVTDPTGKFAQYQSNIFIEKSEEIVIGLTPAFIVAGKINLIRERFSDTRIFASGIKITLMSVSGKEYHTYTNADGSYEITVPRGRYYVKIPNAFKDSRFKIADNFQKVAYDGKVDRQVINFAVTVRSRKTKIKYFGKQKE